jgi:branched-chain amino acid transport system permease protein
MSKRLSTLLYVAVLAALVLLPGTLADYQISLAQKVLIFILFAVSFDLLYGYAGLPSLGHAAFFGAGGYAAALLMTKADVESAWLILPIGTIVGAVIAAIFAPIALRTTGSYFLLMTFALGQLLATLAIEMSWLQSPGIEGLIGIGLPELGFGFEWDSISTYYFVLAVVAVGYLFALRVTRSPLGHAAKGVREDEGRMRVLGYNTWLIKYKLFVISGALAALAGQLFAFTSGAVVPADLDITYSAAVFLMVVMGGIGRIYGAAAGATIFVLFEYYVQTITPERWPLALGALFILVALVARDGVVGLVKPSLDAGRSLLRRHRPGST